MYQCYDSCSNLSGPIQVHSTCVRDCIYPPTPGFSQGVGGGGGLMGLLPNVEGSHVVLMEVSTHIQVHMTARVTPGPALPKPTLVTTKLYWHTVSDYKSCIASELVYSTKCQCQ